MVISHPRLKIAQSFPGVRRGFLGSGDSLKNGATLIILLILPPTLSGQEPQTNGRVVTATYIESTITIDGNLTEPAWETAQPAEDFIQKDPEEGKPATERTVVRVLYDKENLYIGAYCYDRTPKQIVIHDITRDFVPLQEDQFVILLDTFHDKRNGLVLITTPKGGQRDNQFLNEGRDVNVNWDGVWYVESRIHENGWTAEFSIPFKTLRFHKENVQVWGINFYRIIRRRNEFSTWSPVPRRYNPFQASRAGELRGLQGIKEGRNLKIKPFALGGLNHFSSRENRNDGKFEGGVDVKYGLTPSLTLDLTLNTDFSHVEVDTQQVNLTRFPLFFPEKREFFLENAGLFQLGETYRVGPPRNNEAILFFSRRIGLTQKGEPVPILGGVRLTGRAGPYYLGLINIQTRSEEATPANNFTVGRFRRDILSNSDVGFLFTNRQSGQHSDYNRVFGADVNFKFFRDLKINALLGKTQTPGLRGDNGIGKVEMQWQDNLFHFIGSYLDIQKNFKPEMGFVRRPGRKILHHEFGIRPRLQRTTRLGSIIREFIPLVVSDYAILPNGETETKFLRSLFRIEFQDGGAFETQYNQNFERLTQPFEIPLRRGTTIPIGDYRFNEFVVWYFSDKSKLFSIDGQYNKGDFYDGKKTTLNLEGRFQPGFRFSTSVEYERNNVKLPQRSFITDLVGFRMNYTFTPRMFLNAFIQYNSDTNQVSSNIRFRLIHHPLSDLFLVYSEQRDVQQERADRSISFKYTHLLNF